MVTRSYQTALLQYGETKKLENQVMIELQRSMLKIQQLALRYKERFVLKSNEMRDLHRTLKNAQIAGFLLGQQRARKSMAGVKLASLDDIINNLRKVNKSKIDQLSSYYEVETLKVVSEMTTKINASVRKALAESTAAQLQTKSATEILASALNRAGITPTNSYYAENIVRTHTQMAYNAARWQEYQSEEVDSILWGYTYVTVGDDRVREEHAKLDGITLPKDDPFWLKFWPPNGYSCRCQTIPLFQKERIKRPGKDVTTDKGWDFNPGEIVEQLAS